MLKRKTGILLASTMVAILLSGCSLSGLFTGQGDTVQRVLADAGCLAALAGAAVQVAGDPAVGGAKTAMDVLGAIGSVGASNIPGSVLSACGETLKYAQQDAAGAIAYLKGVKGTDQQLAPPPPAQRANVFAPRVPTIVTVPIPR